MKQILQRHQTSQLHNSIMSIFLTIWDKIHPTAPQRQVEEEHKSVAPISSVCCFQWVQRGQPSGRKLKFHLNTSRIPTHATLVPTFNFFLPCFAYFTCFNIWKRKTRTFILYQNIGQGKLQNKQVQISASPTCLVFENDDTTSGLPYM